MMASAAHGATDRRRLFIFFYSLPRCSARHVRVCARMMSPHDGLTSPSSRLVVTFFLLFGGRHLGRGRDGRRARVLRWHSAALAPCLTPAGQVSHRHELGHEGLGHDMHNGRLVFDARNLTGMCCT